MKSLSQFSDCGKIPQMTRAVANIPNIIYHTDENVPLKNLFCIIHENKVHDVIHTYTEYDSIFMFGNVA